MTRLFAWSRKFLLLMMSGFAFRAVTTDAALINGRNYVPLTSWAYENGFMCYQSQGGDRVVATNRTTRLAFAADARDAGINGVEVALCYPPANVKGTLLISQLDLDATVRPLVFPQKFPAKRITTICLDPGHGGKDTGNHVGWHYEKVYTLALAATVRDELKSAGFNVIMTRTKDASVGLADRPALANRLGADLFVSLHFNATPTGKNEVEGPQTYCITPVGASSTDAQGEGSNYGPTPANRVEQRSLLLAYDVQRSLVRTLGAEDRGVRRARFAVLRDATMPAILVEGGYMTHPIEGRKIFSDAYRRQMAQAIVTGILAYQKYTAPAVRPSPPATLHSAP